MLSDEQAEYYETSEKQNGEDADRYRRVAVRIIVSHGWKTAHCDSAKIIYTAHWFDDPNKIASHEHSGRLVTKAFARRRHQSWRLSKLHPPKRKWKYARPIKL